jgi:cytoskeletal protein RodZ
MYEQGETPTLRRRLWVVLWFVVIVLVLWALVWLLFFRHTAPKVTTLHGSNTSQNQSSNNNANTKNTGSSSTDTTTPSSSGTTTTPDGLANAGPGNIWAPFAVASVAGGALYYVRLRKKLLS